MGITRGRIGAAVAGVTAVALLGACGSGDSTVAGPASSPDDSTTAVTSSAPAPSSASPDSASSSPTVGGSSLPATAPSGTSAPPGFPGGAAAAPGSNAEAYLAELRRQNVVLANDTDNSIALGAGGLVCSSKARNVPPGQVKTLVTAIVGSGTTDAALASANADKVIAAATATYCR